MTIACYTAGELRGRIVATTTHCSILIFQPFQRTLTSVSTHRNFSPSSCLLSLTTSDWLSFLSLSFFPSHVPFLPLSHPYFLSLPHGSVYSLSPFLPVVSVTSSQITILPILPPWGLPTLVSCGQPHSASFWFTITQAIWPPLTIEWNATPNAL